MRRILPQTLLLACALMGAVTGELAAQQVVGRVVNTTDMSVLAGAKVTIVGWKHSTVTDKDGYFGFKNLPTGKLAFRVEKPGFVSMVEDVDVEPQAVTMVRFEVAAVAAFLKQLTVVGHRRSDATSGDAVVKGGDQHVSDRTAVDLLAYRVPGLVVTRNSAGQGIRVLIRGVSSLSLNNDPAVYVDGVRTHSLDQLEDISAADVERIRVLRGAASATLYPDGANGVILIQTRQGPSVAAGG